MNYNEATEYINAAGLLGSKPGLKRIEKLCRLLGDPQEKTRFVHIAGTNGKGSTAAMISGILTAAGYKTGLYTSPHLCFFEERISVGGAPIGKNRLADIIGRIKECADKMSDKPTEFEIATAAAFLYFCEEKCDIAVLETGLGGRLDATNSLGTSLSLIASIGLDHMSVLGDTVEKIAFEKAGIMRTGVPCVVMPQAKSILEVFSSHAVDVGAPLYLNAKPEALRESFDGSVFCLKLPVSGPKEIVISMAGSYQTYNASLALCGLDLLGIDMDKAIAGVSNTRWAGRLDLRDNVLIDCAHNPQGMNTLKEYVLKFFPDRKRVGLIGMMKDKQVDACASILQEFTDTAVATNVSWPRAISAGELSLRFSKPCTSVDNVPDALNKAKELAGENGLVICAGSVYLAGDVINLIEGN